jgi:hypothetical protein
MALMDSPRCQAMAAKASAPSPATTGQRRIPAVFMVLAILPKPKIMRNLQSKQRGYKRYKHFHLQLIQPAGV